MTCALAAAASLSGCTNDDESGTAQAARAEPTPKADVAIEPEPEPQPQPERKLVYSLVDNRVLMHHRAGGGLYVHAGTAGFAKYSRFFGGWSYSRDIDGVRAAVSTRRTARIDVPADEGAAATDPIWLRVHSKKPRTLRVGDERLELSGGWETISAKQDLASGENRITLGNAAGLAVAWMQLAGNKPNPVGRPFPIRDGKLELRQNEAAMYYVFVPEDAVVVGDVTPAGCDVSVGAIGSGELVRGSLPVADISELAGQVVRLEVESSDCESVSIAGAGIAVPGTAPEVPSRGEPPKHVLLWVMDTLRADRVRIVTPDARPEVPSFERLAKRGVVFRQAYVQGNESQASHASLWTSTYPAVHELRTAGVGGVMSLKKRLRTLPQFLKQAGLNTYGITANGMITRGNGFAKGFDTFDNPMRDGTGKRRNGWIPANRLSKRLIDKLSDKPTEPWFLFLGTIDTHKPWVGHEPWLSQYDPAPYRGLFSTRVRPGHLGIVAGSMRCVKVPKPRDLQRINAIYDSDVSFQDQHLGIVLDKLEEWGVLDDTMIIVTADHGEELWEVGRCGHGASLRETLVHVPLVISYPPMFPSGEVVEEGVDVLDVMPTLADVFGAESSAQLQGASLRPLSFGVGRGYPRASYASQYEYAHAMRIGPWKIRVGKTTELYDLDTDPDEKTNVRADRPIARRFMTDALATFLAYRRRWKKAQWGPVNNMTERAAGALERQHK